MNCRKTCVQKLKNAGVPRDQIIDVTGHRNVQSLNSYEGDDENQSRQLSNIISGCQEKVSQPSKNTISQPLQPLNTVWNAFHGTVNFYGTGHGLPGMAAAPSTIEKP